MLHNSFRKDMPNILEGLEQIERARLNCVHRCMRRCGGRRLCWLAGIHLSAASPLTCSYMDFQVETLIQQQTQWPETNRCLPRQHTALTVAQPLVFAPAHPFAAPSIPFRLTTTWAPLSRPCLPFQYLRVTRSRQSLREARCRFVMRLISVNCSEH